MTCLDPDYLITSLLSDDEIIVKNTSLLFILINFLTTKIRLILFKESKKRSEVLESKLDRYNRDKSNEKTASKSKITTKKIVSSFCSSSSMSSSASSTSISSGTSWSSSLSKTQVKTSKFVEQTLDCQSQDIFSFTTPGSSTNINKKNTEEVNLCVKIIYFLILQFKKFFFKEQVLPILKEIRNNQLEILNYIRATKAKDTVVKEIVIIKFIYKFI